MRNDNSNGIERSWSHDTVPSTFHNVVPAAVQRADSVGGVLTSTSLLSVKTECTPQLPGLFNPMIVPNYMPFNMQYSNFPFGPQMIDNQYFNAAVQHMNYFKYLAHVSQPATETEEVLRMEAPRIEVPRMEVPPLSTLELRPTVPDVLSGAPRSRRVKRGISPSKKDEQYYDRRKKNNRAAKKSREKQRISNLRCKTSLLCYHQDVDELTTTLKRLVMSFSIPINEVGSAARFLTQPVTPAIAYDASMKMPSYSTSALAMSNVNLLIEEGGAPIKRFVANEYQKCFHSVPHDLSNPDMGIVLNDFNLYDRLHPNLESILTVDDVPEHIKTPQNSPVMSPEH